MPYFSLNIVPFSYSDKDGQSIRQMMVVIFDRFHDEQLWFIFVNYFSDTQRNANAIAKLVKVKYCDVKKPVTSLREAIELQQFHEPRFPAVSTGDTEGSHQLYD